jgi:hypothetical protein
MDERQEIIAYMKDSRTRKEYNDPYELAKDATDMFDLWDDYDIPDWIMYAAEDIFYG